MPATGFNAMTNILGLSGSLRRHSFNTALLRQAVSLMPVDSTLEVRTLHGIPLFNADEEAEQGIPAAVAELKEAIAAAAGVILATPEYNNSMPGVFKNAIDWLSRPPSDIKRVFGGKPVAIMGASAGGFGTVLSQAAWLPVMRTLGVALWAGGRLIVPRAGGAFNRDDVLVDDQLSQQLRVFLAGFVASVERR
jgi:chromate reductase, NAD(P)H dehydrogenase (quinone)